jgi:3-hydroxyacyl-CoA dehydrogenase / enoyl-CoA hydratase / 3-hydroxybutyryl-CoA epimerase
MSSFTLDIQETGIATLTFDMPDSSVNLLSTEVLLELDDHLSTLQKQEGIKILLVQSAKDNIFIAGANIEEIKALNDEEGAYDIVRKGQNILIKLEHLPYPTVAVIDGACLGGGFELALRCNYRICTESSATKIGLPEVNLGVLPGFGGTQTLKNLIGPSKALELILGGKVINGKKALKLGMVDACVPHGYLGFKLETLVEQILDTKKREKILAKRYKKSFVEKWLPFMIWKVALKTVMKKTKGQYPAPLAIIKLFKKTQGLPHNEALHAEAHAFSQLAVTDISKNLISLFFAVEGIKNEKLLVDKKELLPIEVTSVVGGGTMGGGIVWLFAKIGKIVRLKVRGFAQAAATIRSVASSFEAVRKRRRLTAREVDMKMTHISYGTDYKSLKTSDLVVEAIVENVEAKQQAYKELEAVLHDNAIIASNTSSLSITMLSESMEHPERFVGMHFFNPVPLMPLVEVIPGEKTDDKVISTVVDLAKKAGKTPIVVKDCAGFLVNRILLPYINESAKILEEGGSIVNIDKVIVNFGMPMGPFTLADEVGLDVGYKVAKVLEEGYGERMKVSTLLDRAFNELKLMGKKGKEGFYIHDGKDKEVNQAIAKLQTSSHTFDSHEIIDRAILTMVNEAARCLEEGVVKDAQHLDVGMIMGTGFPPFRGGLLKYADSLGIKNVQLRLEKLADKYGSRFEPAKLIVSMAESNETFYKG